LSQRFGETAEATGARGSSPPRRTNNRPWYGVRSDAARHSGNIEAAVHFERVSDPEDLLASAEHTQQD
jgi:hypothetical protein